jgi:hypothetical protein
MRLAEPFWQWWESMLPPEPAPEPTPEPIAPLVVDEQVQQQAKQLARRFSMLSASANQWRFNNQRTRRR